MKAILFVDDHEVLARLACEILQHQGYRAEYAYNASDALTMFDREQFDLLVTDYKMEEMNGLELARRVRQKSPGLPIIMVSGFAESADSGEVNAWIEKHDMFPALLDKIRMFLGEGEPEKNGQSEALKSA